MYSRTGVGGGVIERLPERVRTLLVAGAGTAAAILGGVPIAAAAVVGAACWLGRVAMAVPRRPAGEKVEPRRLVDPWRGFVVEAQAAKRRFDQTCQRAAPGPLRE